jgi:hypothetical protein
MQAGDANVDNELGGTSQVAGRELRFLADRHIGGSGSKHHNESSGACRRFGRPGEQVGLLIMKGVWEFSQDGGGMILARSSEQGDVRLLAHSGGDHANLLGRLSRAIDRFWIAPSPGPIVIETGERFDSRPSARGFSHDLNSATAG